MHILNAFLLQGIIFNQLLWPIMHSLLLFVAHLTCARLYLFNYNIRLSFIFSSIHHYKSNLKIYCFFFFGINKSYHNVSAKSRYAIYSFLVPLWYLFKKRERDLITCPWIIIIVCLCDESTTPHKITTPTYQYMFMVNNDNVLQCIEKNIYIVINVDECIPR